MYFGQGNPGWCPRWAASTDNLCDTGQARPELAMKPGCKSVGDCMCGTGRRAQGACGQWGYYGGVRPEGVQRRGLTLFRRMRAALFLGCCSAPIGSALACCLLLCRCIALPCPLTRGDPTGQRSSLLLMLKLCAPEA